MDRVDEGSDPNVVSTSVIPLPILNLSDLGVDVSASLPSQAYVNEPFAVAYQIVNRSETKMEETQIVVDHNDAFVFAGQKQAALRLLPLQSVTIQQRCMPVASGHLALPHCRVLVKKREGDWMSVPSTLTPTSIFIMPCRKLK
jgi:hypothetical protein